MLVAAMLVCLPLPALAWRAWMPMQGWRETLLRASRLWRAVRGFHLAWQAPGFANALIAVYTPGGAASRASPGSGGGRLVAGLPAAASARAGN